jgi:predicted enzyme related to lactoylglutathione lyase
VFSAELSGAVAARHLLLCLARGVFQTVHTGSSDYAVARANGRPVGGLFQKSIPAGERRRSAWLTFIAVSDVDAAKRPAGALMSRVCCDAA